MIFGLLETRCVKLIEAISSARLAKALFGHKVLVGAEHRHIFYRRWATVVDVGANRGQFALAVRRWAPQAHVIAFEPLPIPAEIFRSVFVGDECATLYESAIGPKVAQSEMHISARDDSSSLLPISDLQSKTFPGTAKVSTLKVPVAPLDVFIVKEQLKAPALLKMDVQGFEFEALKGCESLLSFFGNIYCECSFVELYSGQKLAPDVIEWLAVRNFRLIGVYNAAYDRNGKAVQADFLFERTPDCES